uniref:Methyltransf_21 domain-containing protein n=1 Tax=Steinernema glaseri TaxID=37863 RepID=A0A1I7ZA63_9BILA
MLRPSALFCLRCTAIFLSLLVLWDIGTLSEIFTLDGLSTIKNSVERRAKLYQSESPILWEEIDLENPPFLNDTSAESLRFNEFLARPIYICKNRTEIGGDYDGFFYCYDRTPADGIQKPLLITGSLYTEGDFEKRLRADRWKVFLPQSSAILEDLTGDVEVNYLPSLSEWKSWDLAEVTRNLEGGERFSLAKIDLFSPLLPEMQLSEIPKLLRELIPHIRAEQLLLTIRIEEADAAETFFRWYSTLYHLFFKWDFALVGAEVTGNCGRPLKHCRYRATLAKTDVFGVRQAPVFGLGSPIEERKRLQQYLSRPELNCSSKTDSTPAICLDKVNPEACHVNFFSYRKVEPRILRSLPCKVVLFDPEPDQEPRPMPSNVEIVAKGVSPRNESLQVSGYGPSKWSLSPIEELLADREQEILAFDLEGAEWDLLAATTESCAFFLEVQQVAFRLRLWIGEENENFRRFYLFFLRLEHCGFQKTIARRIRESEFAVSFQRVRV